MINKYILNAVYKLIRKYSDTSNITSSGMNNCSLCIVCNDIVTDSWCKKCPNNYFKGTRLGCSNRTDCYPDLDYSESSCYPALKRFWTIFADNAEKGLSNNVCIEIALKNYNNEEV